MTLLRRIGSGGRSGGSRFERITAVAADAFVRRLRSFEEFSDGALRCIGSGMKTIEERIDAVVDTLDAIDADKRVGCSASGIRR